MNKPLALTSVALLASLIGCAPTASDDAAALGEAAQADVIGGTWTTSVLPRGTSGTAVCQVDTTTFTVHVEVPASSNTITLTEVDKCAGSDCKDSTNGAGPLTATTSGASAHFSDPAPGDGFSATLVAALDGSGNITLGIATGTFQDGGSPPQDFGCSPMVLAYSTASVTAESVAVSAPSPYVGSTLTGSYTFGDTHGNPEDGTTYQWYRYVGSLDSPISGATGETYPVTSADAGNQVQFCVTPATAYVTGAQVCSSPVTVPDVVWYVGESQTGGSVGETYENGACVNMSALDLTFTPASLALYAQTGTETYIYMYEGSDCSGAEFTRDAGAGTVHNINLDTVGIGSSLVSYKVTW